MRRSLVKTVARLAGWRALGLATAVVLIAASSYGQAPAPEKKPAAGEKPSAAQQQLPKADEIIAKMIEASGGEATMKKITTRVSKGTFEQGPAKASITSYEAAPNKALQVIEVPGGPTVEQGTNGEVFWEQQTGAPPRVLGKEEAALAARHSDFYSPLDWRKYYTSAETVGTDTVNGHPAYKIVMTPKEGPAETWYVDQKTNLLDRIDLTVTTPMGEGVVETYLEDYRKQEGVMVPFKTRQLLGGQQMAAVTWNTVDMNADIPKDRFDPPAGVKEQLKPGGAASTQPGQSPKPEKPEKPSKP